MLGCFAPQLAGELLAGEVGLLVGAALLAAGRLGSERGVAVGDLVLDAVPGHRACRAVPALRVRLAVGSFAERVARPLRPPLDFAVGEFVAQLGVLALERPQSGGEAVAFLADGRDVAELAAERGALREDAFELIFGAGERRGEAGAVDDVRVFAAAEPPLLWRG